MKKCKWLCLLLICLLPCSALATTANGTVEAVTTVDVTAPFSGTLLPSDHDAGDAVAAGETLFTLDTLKVYAPADGMLAAVFAEAGDSAADITAQYGMLAAVEKSSPLVISASTNGAYDEKANKLIHIGETLYYYRTSKKADDGMARVIAVSGEQYTLEVLTGDYELGEEVKLYRDSAFTSKLCVGKGRIARGADVPVLGSGRVLKRYASQGMLVRSGDLLYELAADALPGALSADVAAPCAGVLALPKVASGQQVYRGQVLATIHDTSALQVRAEVDEVDLGALQVGDKVELAFDRYPDTRVPGRVASISGVGKTKQNASYYDVCVAFTPEDETLIGMSATVYLPESGR